MKVIDIVKKDGKNDPGIENDLGSSTKRIAVPAKFHIHFDGKVISPELEAFALKLGFWWDNFLSEVPGADSYAPARHLTHKPDTAEEFRARCDMFVSHLNANPQALTGYLECEVIARREEIPRKDFDPSVPFPFRLKLAPLPKGEFRETEIHFSLNKECSDPRLITTLKSAGFFLAYNEREHGTGAILTCQGYRKDIDAIWHQLTSYLIKAGGAVNGEMKEERIARSWMSSPDYPLPPIVKEIK